ncbi:MAG: hypothetical protein A3G34_14800 [Candidatus Lindowbacteria bacterium RIFCSPLOWO2_12_FULL_62_27]|nr:MAG: hypothetical protein A3I06_10080 [Candidatus Lindowbacteria bacterium RIFCSPLOWO2_02_FULL_62_12]OGH63324.1 MAG: hypothetical protein A3G34_14800 [Candidatus Lindowbacteria bacterium RIFCSPLOWO2_12_FULL_62_27]
MRLLHEFVTDPTAERGKRVEDAENEADEARRRLVLELNDSFVTPMDREDIFALSRSVDDMVDYAKTSVEEMLLFKVGSNEHLRKISEGLYTMSKEITLAIKSLRNNMADANEHIIRAKKSENYVEHRYREALAELFNSNDFTYVLKHREVYRHLSNAADRGDHSADIISDIIVKMT